jgi:hypothetical protein
MVVYRRRFSEYIFRHYFNELLTKIGTGYYKMIGHAIVASGNNSMAYHFVTFSLFPGDAF